MRERLLDLGSHEDRGGQAVRDMLGEHGCQLSPATLPCLLHWSTACHTATRRAGHVCAEERGAELAELTTNPFCYERMAYVLLLPL